MSTTISNTRPVATNVRLLLVRGSWYVVPTSTLVAYLAHQIVREQFDHYVEQTVSWVMAQFNVTPVSGGAASKNVTVIAEEIGDLIEAAVGDDDITLEHAVRAAERVLTSVYGNQMRVTGWLPGHRVADGRVVLRLSGNHCPQCTVNPTGYDDRHIERCLNSDDCGWENR